MPLRKIPLVTDEIYHIVNRGNNSIPIFKTKYDYQKFIQIFSFYQNLHPPMKFSKFMQLNLLEKNKILEELKQKGDYLVEIIAYCLMPNHFHFVLKQIAEAGILNFLRLTTDSYSRNFNTKYQRKGSLFEGRFKAIRVETNNQLLHVTRYVHLNPYSSYLVKDLESLQLYPFSSLPEYLENSKTGICQKGIVLNQFPKPGSFQQFTLDQAEYQRSLEQIKHLTID